MKEYQHYQLNWQGIAITVTYCPDYSKAVRQIQGYALAHLTIKSPTRLPVTETGYLSLFLPQSEVQEAGGAVTLVTQALDEAAQSKEWQGYLRESRQLRLF